MNTRSNNFHCVIPKLTFDHDYSQNRERTNADETITGDQTNATDPLSRSSRSSQKSDV